MPNGEKKESKETPEKDRMKEFLAYVDKTDLTYVHVERDGTKISFRRSECPVQAVKAHAVPGEAAPKEEEQPKTTAIRSPIVGRFYSSMGTDRPPLVVEGSKVTAGQKVAIVKAMEINKEVFSPETGTVARIFVRDGDAVEYGQELFSVNPKKEENNNV